LIWRYRLSERDLSVRFKIVDLPAPQSPNTPIETGSIVGDEIISEIDSATSMKFK
jgi:hypothetical protein